MLRCVMGSCRRFPARRGLVGLAALCLFAGAAKAALWPDELAGYKKTSSKPVAISDKALWDEYGLEATEQAEYVSAGKRFEAAAYRLKDPTSALAAFQWQRPADARPSKLSAMAAEMPGSVLIAYGNYLFRFKGFQPKPDDLDEVLGRVPKLDQSPLPTLKDYLPSSQLVPNSERYVIGPVGLEKFDPAIPPSVAAFHMGAEAQLGNYQSKAGTIELAIFAYPTPQIARQQQAEFEKLAGAMAKRTGPLVAVVVSPPDRDEAERLLSQIRYQATVTWSERVPTARDNVANLILNIFLLIGIILAFFIVAGLAFGLMRRWVGWGADEDPMILLHLEDRRGGERLPGETS